MTQKITIPQQNQPFRRQASLGGNVSFRELGGTQDNNSVVMAKVTKVYYKQGRVDFKLTNTVNNVVTEAGDGVGSAPIPIDFYGYQSDGKVFGHYRPIQVGDLVAVAYLWGHKEAPIILGVYPTQASSYEFVAPPDALDSADDRDKQARDYALADRKIYPDGNLEYQTGNGAYYKTLNGHSFMLIDDSPLYDQLWLQYKDIGAFKNSDNKLVEPLHESAGEWLLVHEDNSKAGDADNHRTRFYVKKDGTFQVLFSKSDHMDSLLLLQGSKDEGFTVEHLYDVPQKGVFDLENGTKKNPDLDNAQQYVKFNLGGADRSASIEATTKEDSVEQTSKLSVRADGVYINGKLLVSSDPDNPDSTDNTIIGDEVTKASLLSEAKNLDSAADAAIAYGISVGDDSTDTTTAFTAAFTNLKKAKEAMDDGLPGLFGDSTTTDFDYTDAIQLEQDLRDAINAFHTAVNSDIMARIGTTAEGKNAIYRGAVDPTTAMAGKKPNINDIWIKTQKDGTSSILVWDGKQWINPGLVNIDTVNQSLSKLPQSYYQPDEPVDDSLHKVQDGDTWYKLTKDSNGNYAYVAYKRENGQWVQLLDSNDVANQTAITNLNNSLSKLPQSYYSSTQPAGTDYKDGDIWYKISTNTTNNNVVYTPFKWNPNTNTWDPMLDATSSRNYVGSAPASPLEGDFWMDNTTLKQYQSGQWVVVPTQGAQGIPGKPGADGKTYYTWIMYATDSKGSNMSRSPTGMSYIGIAYNKESPNESSTPTDYTWSLIKGDQGIPGKDGISPINLVIESSNGYQFKNGIINTTLTAKLYQNNKEIDSDGTGYAYVWSKTNADGTEDTAWNLAHQTSQKSITITYSDVLQRATFDCTAESLN